MNAAIARGAVNGLRRCALLALLLPLRFYRRWISPGLPRTCRYYPSCAAYAEQALRTHGPVRGSWLAVRRLARCHPWTPGGVDHVPPARDAGREPTTINAVSAGDPTNVTGA